MNKLSAKLDLLPALFIFVCGFFVPRLEAKGNNAQDLAHSTAMEMNQTLFGGAEGVVVTASGSAYKVCLNKNLNMDAATRARFAKVMSNSLAGYSKVIKNVSYAPAGDGCFLISQKTSPKAQPPARQSAQTPKDAPAAGRSAGAPRSPRNEGGLDKLINDIGRTLDKARKHLRL